MANEEKIVKTRIRHKIGTTEKWNEAGEHGFVPLEGEPIYYRDGDVVRCKVGDGSTNVKDLPFDENTNAIERIIGLEEVTKEQSGFDGSTLKYNSLIDACSNDAPVYSLTFLREDFPIHCQINANGWGTGVARYFTGLFHIEDEAVYVADTTGDLDTFSFNYTLDEEEATIYVENDLIGIYADSAYADIYFDYSADDESAGQLYSLPSNAKPITDKNYYETIIVETYDKVRYAQEADYATNANYATSCANASTATKATKDSSNNTITSYYSKHPTSTPLSLNGDSLQIKYTRGSNSSQTYAISLANLTTVKNHSTKISAHDQELQKIKGYQEEGDIISFDENELRYSDYASCGCSILDLAFGFTWDQLSEGTVIHARADEFYATFVCTGSIQNPVRLADQSHNSAVEIYNNLPEGGYLWIVIDIEHNDEIWNYIEMACNISFRAYEGVTYNAPEGQNSVLYKENIPMGDGDWIYVPVRAATTLYDENGDVCLTWADIQVYIDQRIQEALANQ